METPDPSRFATRDLDVIFLSFDEPNAEDNWADLVQHRPDAKRVDGIVGPAAAHVAAAQAAQTDRFVLVDADTRAVSAFWDATIRLSGDLCRKTCLMFCARNAVNGLVTGYGGVKIFSRDYLLRHASDENQVLAGGTIDYLWDHRFLEFAEVWGTTHFNASPSQTLRGGLREGMKLSKRLLDNPDLAHIHYQRRVWCSVGSDVEHGLWAIGGALRGTKMILDGTAIPNLLNDYAWLGGVCHEMREWCPTIDRLNSIAERLDGLLGERIRVLPPDESRAFKANSIMPPPVAEDTSVHYENWSDLKARLDEQ